MASVENPPAPPNLARFPAVIGQWRLFRPDPLDAQVEGRLGGGCAGCLLSQTYLESPTNAFASLLIAWFPTQRGGVRQPPSPKLCLPGAGWTPRVVDEVTVSAAAGPITVNRYIVDRGEPRWFA